MASATAVDTWVETKFHSLAVWRPKAFMLTAITTTIRQGSSRIPTLWPRERRGADFSATETWIVAAPLVPSAVYAIRFFIAACGDLSSCR